MNIILLTVGRTDVKWVAEGLELYASRLRHYAPFTVCEIPQLKNVGAFSPAQIKQKEGVLILSKVKPADEVILMDERGKQYTSLDFAAWLQDRLVRVRGDVVFVIGGAYGFSEEVYARANGKVSLSKMTFSHQMVRTIFAEQLYRAFTIIKGDPYHNE